MNTDNICYDKINGIVVFHEKIIKFLSCLGTIEESDNNLLKKIIDKDDIGYLVLNENVNIFVYFIYDGAFSISDTTNIKYSCNGFGIQREYLNNIYIGFFKNNQKHGFGVANLYGNVSIGFWENNQKHGYHILKRSRIVYVIYNKFPKKKPDTFQIGMFDKNRLINGYAFNPVFLQNAFHLGFNNTKIILIHKIVEKVKKKYYLYQQEGKCLSSENYNIIKKIGFKEYLLSKNYIYENELYSQYFHYSNEKKIRSIISFKKNPIKIVLRWNDENCEKMEIFYSNGELIQNPCDVIQKKFIDSVPKYYLCPIGMDIMIQPAITEKKFTYEYKHIKKWFKKRKTEPLTNEHNSSCSLKFNSQLQMEIFQFICDFFSSKEYKQEEQSETKSSK